MRPLIYQAQSILEKATLIAEIPMLNREYPYLLIRKFICKFRHFLKMFSSIFLRDIILALALLLFIIALTEFHFSICGN